MRTKSNRTKTKRYSTVSYRGTKGIRKDSQTNTFLVEKKIRGRRYSATFNNIREAADWKRNFHPAVSLSPMKRSEKIGRDSLGNLPWPQLQRSDERKNGEDFGLKFGDVWAMYAERHLAKLEFASRLQAFKFRNHFFKALMNTPMVKITAGLISAHIEAEKESSGPKRYNFNSDLKYLKSFLNWYRENVDPLFTNPILKRHKEEGFIRHLPKRKKKMRVHELKSFFQTLKDEGELWRDFAEVQFYFSGRVQEVAGLQWGSVDFIDGEIEIENVAVWDNKKNFCSLKPSTKNGETRKVPMNGRLSAILARRQARRNSSCVWDSDKGKKIPCDFVFHIEGAPLKYRMIQHHYNRALKKAGLGERYASTHILRHTMANLVRERLDIEHAQAVGGWKTRALVEKVYTEAPARLTVNALRNIEEFVEKS